MFFLLYVLLGIGILILLSGGYVFVLGCVRGKDMPWLIKEEIEKTPYGRFHECMADADRWLTEHEAKDVYITSHDGLKLYAQWVPAENARGTVLLAHGYRSTKLLDFGVAFEICHDMGLNLLIPDQRSHGKSEGKYITFGVKESRDMLDWLRFHDTQIGSYPVILFGLSMGASTMMYLADEALPSNVKGIVADCGFTSPKAILSQVYRKVIHLPPEPSVWAAGIFTRLIAGFSLTEKDSRRTLANNTLPILLIHGTADDFVPCYMTRQSFAACSGPKEMLLVQGADHGVSFLVDPKTYSSRMCGFIETCLQEQEKKK